MYKVVHTDKTAVETFTSNINDLLYDMPSDCYQIVVICIGTDRSTGDSLGPLVGTYLKKAGCPVYVYGTVEEPVHAMNLEDHLFLLKRDHPSAFVIAIDACLGQVTSVGVVRAQPSPLKPGAGVNKDLPPVGNMSVTGIVNVGGFMEYFVLQNTRLSLVLSMAEVISQSLINCLSVPLLTIKEIARERVTLREAEERAKAKVAKKPRKPATPRKKKELEAPVLEIVELVKVKRTRKKKTVPVQELVEV